MTWWLAFQILEAAFAVIGFVGVAMLVYVALMEWLLPVGGLEL